MYIYAQDIHIYIYRERERVRDICKMMRCTARCPTSGVPTKLQGPLLGLVAAADQEAAHLGAAALGCSFKGSDRVPLKGTFDYRVPLKGFGLIYGRFRVDMSR